MRAPDSPSPAVNLLRAVLTDRWLSFAIGVFHRHGPLARSLGEGGDMSRRTKPYWFVEHGAFKAPNASR